MGTGTGAEPIQFQSQIPDLIKTLTGTKTTTENGANIDPLQQVFQAAMTAQGAGVPEMQQLIQSIFQEGAKSVPGLVQGYANATGTRATNNSAIQLAIQDLNRQMSTQAATAILDNQNKNRQIAGQAGGDIANATRTQKQVVKPAVNPLLPILAGFALNKAGAKGGFLDKLWGAGDQPVPGGSGDTTAIGYDPGAIPVAQATPDGSGVAPSVTSAADNFTTDLSSGLDMSGFGAGDIGPGMVGGDGVGPPDISGGFPDPSTIGPPDVSDVSDPDVLSLFGWKNGGAVTDVAVKRMSPMSAPARGYADGGAITSSSPESISSANTDGGTIVGVPDDLRKKKSSVGTDNPMMLDSNGNAGVGAASINAFNFTSPGGNDSNTFSPFPGGGGTIPIDGLGGNEVVNFDHNTDGDTTVGGNEPIPDVARLAISTIVGLITHVPPPIISLVLKHLTGKVTAGPIDFKKAGTPAPAPAPLPTGDTKADNTGTVDVKDTGDTSADSSLALDNAIDAANTANAPGNSTNPGLAARGMYDPDAGTAAAAAGSQALADQAATDAKAASDAVFAGDGMGPPDVGSGGASFASADSGSSGGMAGDGMGPPEAGGGGSGGGGINLDEAPDAMAAANGGLVSALTASMQLQQRRKKNPRMETGDAGYSDGGFVEGPGTGTSDSIPTRLSNGEYVIPADVVHMFGTQALDKILAGFHTPTP